MINIDITKLDKLIKNTKYLNEHIVKVGVLGGNYKQNKQHKNKINKKPKISNKSKTIASIGLIQELGSITLKIPARSFIKEPLNDNLTKKIKELSNINNKLYRLLLNNPNKLLDVLGLMGKNIIQDSFIHNDWLPNSPITIQKKKSSKPLIDTGLLRKSIDYEVI